MEILLPKELPICFFQKKQKLDNSNGGIDDGSILVACKDEDKTDSTKEHQLNIHNIESNHIHSYSKEANNVTKQEEITYDLVKVSTVADGNQNRTKSDIGSNNDGSGHNEDHDMDNKTSNESHISNNDVSEILIKDNGESTTDSVSQDKLDQDESKNNNEVKKKETEDFNSNYVNTNIPDNEQCDICGQFVYNSDIIYYQGHPQDAMEEYIALISEKLVLSAGNF